MVLSDGPRVAVCVATRGRGAAIAPTLESLARLDHDSFRVIIVDQGPDERARVAYVTSVGADPRFTYMRSDTVGSSIARNVAIDLAISPILAFTDDDCVVPRDWLTLIEGTFRDHPDVWMLCGAVIPGEHDALAGAIPAFTPRHARKITSAWVKYRTRGIGANLAVRRAGLATVGGFDEVLGAGGPLKSCEDGDMVYRFLRLGLAVLEVPVPAVIHNGFRTWPELRTLSRGALMACGADCMKHLRLGDPAILPTLLFLWLFRTIRWSNVFHLRRPVGAALFIEFARGMVVSFRYGVDRQSRTYVPRSKEESGTGRDAAATGLASRDQDARSNLRR